MYNLKYRSDNGTELNFTIPTRYNTNCLVITESKGLTENTVEMITSQGVSQIGETVQEEAVQGKSIVIEGMILGAATAYRKLLLDAITPKVGGTLIYDNTLKMRVRPQITPAIERISHDAKFQFTVYAPYPYWQYIEGVKTDIAGLIASFRFPINYSNTGRPNPLLHIFGERIPDIIKSVVNEGNVSAPFVVKFVAKTALENPKITLVEQPESTKFLRVEKPMVAGEVITIDLTATPIKVTSTLGGVETDIFGYFDIDSTIFELEPGDNLFRYDADVNKDGLDCFIIYNPTVSGAFGDDSTYI